MTGALLDQYHGTKPWSLGGQNIVLKSKQAGNKHNIDALLKHSDIYTRFKRHRKPSKYSHIYVYKRRELFQSDTVFFTNKDLVAANGGFKYLFTTIDVFTKMAWVYPMKNNNCATVMNCFKDILSKCGDPPERLNSDRGSELICKSFEHFLKDQNIHHYVSYSIRKCPVIERFNLSIQNLLYRLMALHRTFAWSSLIEQAMKIYLNRKHRTIKMSPVEADRPRNEEFVRAHFLIKYNKARKKKTAPKFKVSDTVRIWKEKSKFARGYAEAYSKEHFTIVKVKTNLPVARYILQDSAGELVIGSFFGDELVKYVPPEFYDVNVVKQRQNGKKTEYLVHYLGFPSSMDVWLGPSQLTPI